MEFEGYLIGFALLSLVLTGFVSIFVVFLVSEEHKSRANTFHALAMVAGSLVSLAAALLPLLLHSYGHEGAVLWWWSSLGTLLVGASYFLLIIGMTVQLNREQLIEVGLVHLGMGFLMGTAALTLLAWNLAVDVYVGHYLTALGLCFLVSLSGFTTFCLQRVFYW